MRGEDTWGELEPDWPKLGVDWQNIENFCATPVSF